MRGLRIVRCVAFPRFETAYLPLDTPVAYLLLHACLSADGMFELRTGRVSMFLFLSFFFFFLPVGSSRRRSEEGGEVLEMCS
jgi:hypothetical protein